VLGTLAVERDLGDHAQAAHLGRRHDGHLALDDAGLHQAPYPAQRGGRRHMRRFGQRLVGA
jgi:hypothetical protein